MGAYGACLLVAQRVRASAHAFFSRGTRVPGPIAAYCRSWSQLFGLNAEPNTMRSIIFTC